MATTRKGVTEASWLSVQICDGLREHGDPSQEPGGFAVRGNGRHFHWRGCTWRPAGFGSGRDSRGYLLRKDQIRLATKTVAGATTGGRRSDQ